MNRHQRRAVAKTSQGKLGAATGQLGQALEAVKQLQGLDNVVKLIESAYDKLKDIPPVVDALLDDVQSLSDEADDRDEVLLWLLAALKYPNEPMPPYSGIEELRALRETFRRVRAETHNPGTPEENGQP